MVTTAKPFRLWVSPTLQASDRAPGTDSEIHDDPTKPHGRDLNRFRRLAFRQTERIGPGGLSDRPQEPTRRRYCRRGIRPRGAHGLASCGSALEGAGWDGRSTGTG